MLLGVKGGGSLGVITGGKQIRVLGKLTRFDVPFGIFQTEHHEKVKVSPVLFICRLVREYEK